MSIIIFCPTRSVSSIPKCIVNGLPKVYSVETGSIADEAGILPNDLIVSINDCGFADLIDYKYLISDCVLKIVINRDGQEFEFHIEKDYDEDLGIVFENAVFDGIRRCHNKCIFCFVDQLPKGMRKSLYVKDDDYRLSVLSGNFVTLTNMLPDDFERITSMHLGPLYISVHTTDPELRVSMLNNPAASQIMEQLTSLAKARVTMHTQIVLCPGINDGRHLEKTVSDLSRLWPYVRSIGIVPVGLTGFRSNLFPLRAFTSKEAMELVTKVHGWQGYFKDNFGYPLVFLADELYLRAGVEVPLADEYKEFPQLENGIGIMRLFLDEVDEVKGHLPARVDKGMSVSLVTGVSGGIAVRELVNVLNSISNVTANMIVVKNSFFGDTITVTGLLTGQDIADELARHELGDVVAIPKIMLRAGDSIFLDGMHVNELEQRVSRKLLVVDGPKDLVAQLMTQEFELI